MSNENNECTGCRYFIQHYSLFHGRFQKVYGVGHCVNEQLSKRDKNTLVKRNKACRYWEPMKIQVEERKKTLKGMLVQISKQLKDISTLIKEDYASED